MTDEFVEVRDEPWHRRRFENPHVRVYDVLIPPGDTTLYHRHTEDTLYVGIAEAAVRDQMLGRDGARTGTTPAGMALWRPHRTRPLTHQVQNVGTSDMRLIGAEVRSTPAQTSPRALEARGHELRLENERVRIYDLGLAPGETTGSLRYEFWSLTVTLTIGCLEVGSSDARKRTSILAPGDVVWRPGPDDFSITNVGEAPFAAIVAEWR